MNNENKRVEINVLLYLFIFVYFNNFFYKVNKKKKFEINKKLPNLHHASRRGKRA
jgi:hypothetical protein